MKSAKEKIVKEISAMLCDFGQPLTLPDLRSLQGIVSANVEQIQSDARRSAFEECIALIRNTGSTSSQWMANDLEKLRDAAETKSEG